LLAGCATATPKFVSLDSVDTVQRAISQEQSGYTVRLAVPDSDETQRLFGVPLYKRRIQPVWIEISNQTEFPARFGWSGVDPEYFAPYEVAYLYKKQFSKEGLAQLEHRLYDSAIPRLVPAGGKASGFVFTHLSAGTKAVNVDVLPLDQKRNPLSFIFFAQVPGFRPDHADVDFRTLYAASDIREITLAELPAVLDELPCCSTDRAGTGRGRPANILMLAQGTDLLRALLRGGWSETSYERDERYLDHADYLFGRPPDAVLRKGRRGTEERMELSLWLAPLRVDGGQAWLGLTRHAIGRRFQLSERLLGARQDPDVDDSRNFLMQDLWYAQALAAVSMSPAGAAVSPDAPVLDFHGDPWFSDGLRFLLWVSGPSVALSDTRWIDTGWSIEVDR